MEQKVTKINWFNVLKALGITIGLVMTVWLLFWAMYTMIPPPSALGVDVLESGYSFVKWTVGILLYFVATALGLEFEIPFVSTTLNKLTGRAKKPSKRAKNDTEKEE